VFFIIRAIIVSMKRASLLVVAAVGAILVGRAVSDHRDKRDKTEQVVGLWRLGDARTISDDPVFYYFHKGGKGLYRYGQVGHNQTHSFDWALEGDALALTFRKAGEHARTRFVLGEGDGGRTLTLLEDPRARQQKPGRVRYKYTPTSLDESATSVDDLGGPLALPSEDAAAEDASVAGRIWMDLQRYATGGMGFRMYQLSEHAVGGSPGGKLGWYHHGDFDDWSTETLAYRHEPSALRLRFLLRNEERVTSIELRPARDRRTLFLARDPRNFFHVGRFVDAGRSF
jgi:hypothetical protein